MAACVEVTSADIARLVGVRPSAVTNWRRRHANFPAPVGGSDKSPTFDLAQVADWLRTQGRTVEIPLTDLLWRMLESLRDFSRSTGDNLGIVGLFLLHLHGDLADVPEDREGFTRALTRAEHSLLLRGDRMVAGLRSLLTPIDLTDDHLSVLRLAAQCALADPPADVFDHLCRRYFERSSIGGFTPTPPDLAELMVDLAAPGKGTLLDPACGSAEILLAAARKGFRQLLGQEKDQALARIAVLRLTFATPSPADPRFDVHEGDSLRDDAYPARNAQAVICSPPFSERNWGHDELGLDARWEYGVPPRIEPELAWVQHCLAHASKGSTVVMLMPPAAASRPSGKKVRSALVSRGALRAVIALPPRLAAQYAVALQIWILQPTSNAAPVPTDVLFLDFTDHDALPSNNDAATWTHVRDISVRVWFAFRDDGSLPPDVPQATVLPISAVLAGEVDLHPRRHLSSPDNKISEDDLDALHREVQQVITQLSSAIPGVAQKIGSSPLAREVSLQDLANIGAIFIRRTNQRDSGLGDEGSILPVIQAEDLVAGQPPSSVAEFFGDPFQLVRNGDVLMPLVAPQIIARVAGGDYVGAHLSPSVLLMRANPSLVDPWYLAGYLSSREVAYQVRATGQNQRIRVDPRRIRLPLIDLRNQQAYGRAFRSLMDFEQLLRSANERGRRLAQDLTDTLAKELTNTTFIDPHEAGQKESQGIPSAVTG